MQRQARPARQRSSAIFILGMVRGMGLDFDDAIELAQLREQVCATAKRNRTAFLESD